MRSFLCIGWVLYARFRRNVFLFLFFVVYMNQNKRMMWQWTSKKGYVSLSCIALVQWDSMFKPLVWAITSVRLPKTSFVIGIHSVFSLVWNLYPARLGWLDGKCTLFLLWPASWSNLSSMDKNTNRIMRHEYKIRNHRLHARLRSLQPRKK